MSGGMLSGDLSNAVDAIQGAGGGSSSGKSGVMGSVSAGMQGMGASMAHQQQPGQLGAPQQSNPNISNAPQNFAAQSAQGTSTVAPAIPAPMADLDLGYGGATKHYADMGSMTGGGMQQGGGMGSMTGGGMQQGNPQQRTQLGAAPQQGMGGMVGGGMQQGAPAGQIQMGQRAPQQGMGGMMGGGGTQSAADMDLGYGGATKHYADYDLASEAGGAAGDVPGYASVGNIGGSVGDTSGASDAGGVAAKEVKKPINWGKAVGSGLMAMGQTMARQRYTEPEEKKAEKAIKSPKELEEESKEGTTTKAEPTPPAVADADLKEPGGNAQWTLREENDFLLARNQRTGKNYKVAMEHLTPLEEKQAQAPHGAGPMGADDPNRQRTEVSDMRLPDTANQSREANYQGHPDDYHGINTANQSRQANTRQYGDMDLVSQTGQIKDTSSGPSEQPPKRMLGDSIDYGTSPNSKGSGPTKKAANAGDSINMGSASKFVLVPLILNQLSEMESQLESALDKKYKGKK
jgi:hypothetical protein